MPFKKPAIGLVLILILAGFIRFLKLDSLPIFADESIYVRWSQVMRVEPSLRFLPLSDGKQPLYMWLTIPFLKIITDPLIAGRTLSVLAGVTTCAVLAIAAYFLTGNNPLSGFLGGIIYAVSPYSVFFSRLALVDSLLCLFLLSAFLLSWLACKLNRLDLAMLAGFCLGGAWLTKSPAIFGFLLLPLGIMVAKHKLKVMGYLLTTFIIAFGMYNILRLGQEFHMIALRNQDYVIPLSEVIRHPLDPLIPHLKDSFNFYFYFLTPLGLVFLILGLFAPAPKMQKISLIAWTFIPIFLQATVAKGFTARYLLFTTPFAVLLIVSGIHWLGTRSPRKRLALISATSLCIFSLFIDYSLIVNPATAGLPIGEHAGYLEDWTAGFGIKAIADYIKSIPGSPPILVGAEGYFGTPFDGLKVYLNAYPNVRIIGTDLNLATAPQTLTNALADNQVYWVVNSNRFKGTHDTPSLKLLASYPRAASSAGTRQYLYFFQVLSP